MSIKTLESLVPPLELCKLIPKGEFEETELVHSLSCAGEPFVQQRDIIQFAVRGVILCPAPTLAEIFAKLPQTSSVTWFQQEEYQNAYAVGCYILRHKPLKAKRIVEIDDNPATAALKLWLELKGIIVK